MDLYVGGARFSSGEIVQSADSLAVRIAVLTIGNGPEEESDGNFQQFWGVFLVLDPVRSALAAEAQGLGEYRAPAQARRRPPRLEVIDRLPLTQHHSLHLIRLADRTLLIGLSPNGCNLLESARSSLSSGRK